MGIFFLLLAISISQIVLVSIVPRPSNLPSTPLNTPQTFGKLNKTASLTRSAFNPKNGVLQLNYTINDGANANANYLDISQISFTAIADHGGNNIIAYYIPTSPNTIVVQFKNLNPNFNYLTVTAHDKGINTTMVEAPSSYSSFASSTAKPKQTDKANQGLFTINRDKITVSSSIGFDSQKQLSIAEYNTKISHETEVIEQNQKAIETYKKGIEQQNDLISGMEKQQATTNDSTLQTSIDNERGTLTQIRSKIGEAKANIDHANDQINEYEKAIHRIENGESQLPKSKKI
ncbi:hypothetical protein LNP18_06280 [Leuconostoc citreum]|uniref:hypothetical protein n=1 Tax=Leuconostoc citreum TaxID=33964 RepID=UPI00200B1ECF|nr:hypothetical protein [Leuconostoc citreum]